MEGHVHQLFDFINIGSQRLGGFVSCHLFLSGTPTAPSLFGNIDVQGGFYTNYFVGISIKDAVMHGVAKGNTIVFDKITATDGEKGTSQSSAIFHLKPHLPYELNGTLDHFRILQFDWLTALCSGPMNITGTLDGALAKGDLTIDEADVKIPEQLPIDLPVLPVTFIHQPVELVQASTSRESSFPFQYDLTIRGRDNIQLSGRGLKSELEGDLHIIGKNLTVSAEGVMKTKKGKFSFSGKDFIITQGEVIFSEAGSFLNIAGNLDLPSLSVTVYLRGAFSSPQLTFQSNPPLPTSSILAHILFNKDISELSPTQALQLADTIVTLSGGTGPNVLETIRKNLGIDRLNISASQETGKVSVQIGKYLTEGVMITLNQSTESSQVIVEVELKGGFVLQAETQEDDQAKFTFKWNKNY